MNPTTLACPLQLYPENIILSHELTILRLRKEKHLNYQLGQHLALASKGCPFTLTLMLIITPLSQYHLLYSTSHQSPYLDRLTLGVRISILHYFGKFFIHSLHQS